MALRRWSQSRPRAASAATPASLPRCMPEDQIQRLACGLSGREAKGFGYLNGLRFGEFPHHSFRSMDSCEVGGAFAKRNNGMIGKTPMEGRAMKDARRPLAEALQELGLLGPFHDRGAAKIDRIIEADVDGFQASMQRRASERDPLDDPFFYWGKPR
ncbi:MAG: DUF6511 domain-containing protein [Chloroflexota bacterium]|nr:DUF6511 domain-containing protein [Chloroflexota bacterium]